MYIAVMTPFKIAYIDDETTLIEVTDIIIDVLFLFDILLSFFLAYFDKNQELVVDRRVSIR